MKYSAKIKKLTHNQSKLSKFNHDNSLYHRLIVLVTENHVITVLNSSEFLIIWALVVYLIISLCQRISELNLKFYEEAFDEGLNPNALNNLDFSPVRFPVPDSQRFTSEGVLCASALVEDDN